MNLTRGSRSKIIHLPTCGRSNYVSPWEYGEKHIDSLEALSAHTLAFPLVHADPYCLPGVCQCAACGKKKI